MTNTWILAKMHIDSAQSKADIAEIPSALQVCQAIMQTLKSIRLAVAEDSILVADYKKPVAVGCSQGAEIWRIHLRG